MNFTTEEGDSLKRTFQVSNVTRPTLAADACLEAGSSVRMERRPQRGDHSGRLCHKAGEKVAVMVAETQEMLSESRASVDTNDVP